MAEAFAQLLAASLMVRFLPFRRIAAAARRPVERGESGDSAATVALVTWAIAAAARRARFRAVCIERGIAAQAMLRRRGIAATLHYGVAKTDGDLTAHVWVTWQGRDVAGGAESGAFREMARFEPAATQ